MVVAIDGGIGRASCRSIPGVDIGSAVTAARQSGLIENGGGHAMAAGFTVTENKIEELAIFLMRRLAPIIESAKNSSSSFPEMLKNGGTAIEFCALSMPI